ncbi:unnamed protein product [Didymodactylos carnosus]|uniref:NAD(P)(+)--arginine ADP-ribosyltransferase n=1 Tax=Didymodactylos carnosus TaxID=1234261 RepID=A0A8S2EFV7_9BILA|nr:unnamed protein product [Didymodactylos carnosus]CAF3920042.1 unnamed protein product [Didymodactylos carnosus]
MSENVLILNKDKDLTIIWFDDHLDSEMKQRLEQFHEHVILCFSNDQLMTSIIKIQKHKIILIVSGQYSYQTLQLLHDNDKIDSFYIFCFNNQIYQDLFRDKKYSKLKGIYNEYDQLFNKLENEICSLLKHLSIFSLFDKKNKSIRNLEHESIDFLWYQLLRDTLMNMNTHTDEAKQEMIDYCRLYYHNDIIRLKQIDEFEKTYHSSNAIQWYTKDCFAYRFVNKALRIENVEALYKLRYFIADIYKNIKEIFDENFEIYSEYFETFHFYRGLTLSENDILQIQNCIGKYVSTNGFLSTSRNKNVAELFAANVLFHIQIDTSLNNIIYADISFLSAMTDEEEVLFDLGALFQIINVEYDNGTAKWIVSMVAVNDVECLKNDYFERQRKNMLQTISYGSIEIDVNFGCFLLEMGYYKKAIVYFENLSDHLILNDNDKHHVLSNLSQAYNSNKQYDLALKCQIEALNISNNSNDLNFISKDLYKIGMIYTSQKKYELGLDYLKKSLEVVDKTLIRLIAEIHRSIAKTYCKQGKYFYAFEHAQQSLEIFNNYFSSDLFQICDIHLEMGYIYYSIKDYSMALEHANKTFLIQKQIFTEYNPRFICTYRLIGNIYFSTNQYDLCIEYNMKSLLFEQEQEIKTTDYTILVDIYKNLGYCYMRKTEYEQSIQYLLKSLEIKEKYFPNDQLEVARLNNDIGFCYLKMNRNDLSLNYYNKASVETYEKEDSID